jgi:hypothetical protein
VTTTPATDPYPNISIQEKAFRVWKGATDYAKAKACQIGLYDGVEFYVIDDKPLKYFIGRHFPKIKHHLGAGGTREIYDFLRSTGNYARERDDDDTSIIIVRREFSNGGSEVIFRSPRRAVSEWEKEQARKERKVTPHEAGEDREPEPVVVTTVEQREAEEKARQQAEADKIAVEAIAAAGEAEEPTGGTPGETIDLTTPTGAPSPEDLRLLAEARAAREALTCPECPAETPFVARNPQGLAAHRKSKHGVDGTTYTPSVLGKVTADSPIAEVAMAFDMLREALSKVTEQADHTECEGTLAEARKEAQYQRADAEVQRKRAERAEETLNLIWLAFSTMPQHKAVAEILDLLPPLKDS